MRKLQLPCLVLLGCWTGPRAASPPAAPIETASTGGAAYGGAAYGGAAYGSAVYGGLAQGGAFASLTGTGDVGSGLDEPNVYGGLLEDGEGGLTGGSVGAGGLGLGAGGGGTGWGTIGTGTIGTGTIVRRGRAGAPTVKAGPPSHGGAALDPQIIRRFVHRNLSKIRYCYEKELVADPSLGGTVTVHFTIGPDGHVASASASGSGMPVVEACVISTIRTIQFPRPVGGGAVTVKYPFVFASAGATP